MTWEVPRVARPASSFEVSGVQASGSPDAIVESDLASREISAISRSMLSEPPSPSARTSAAIAAAKVTTSPRMTARPLTASRSTLPNVRFTAHEGFGVRTQARFPGVAPSKGHYESFYLKASAPGGGRSIWLRHTTHQRPGEPVQGSLWLTA